MSKLKIYKASAGSGKTHSLTEEYLKLAAQFPDNFKRILAVTFTNKAAEEMKQRILESLNEIISQGEGASFYHVFFNTFKKLEKFKIIEKVKEVRDSILHNYSYFSLSTIDSFVQKVIKSFTFEIGVESGYRIELDTDRVLTDLTDILYRQIDTDEDLRNWLIHFANYKMDEGKNWDFRTEINKLAREIFKEQFQAFGDDDEIGNDYEYIVSYFDDLNEIKLSFERKMAKIGNIATKLFSDKNIEYASLGQKMKYLGNYLVNKIIDPLNQDDYIPNATVQTMLDEVENWTAKKASAEIKDTVQSLFFDLNPLLNKALKIIASDYRFYLGAINILSAYHSFGILRKLASLLPGYREQNNLLLISDTTRILKEIIAGNDAPFIYEKIGNRYRHVLIDEFQDTSGFQWENFKPLIQNSLAEGQANLIVGDIKQSIYRWRGGDWSLLLSKVEEEIGDIYVQHKNLETNWRSKKNILDFNNSIFKNTSLLLQQLYDSELNNSQLLGGGTQLDSRFENVISRAYADTFQKLPEQIEKKGGRVKIQFFEKKGQSNDWHENVNKELPETIEKLLRQKNYQAGDLAILVRKNSEGKQVASLLLDHQNSKPDALKYQIISSDSLLLGNSPVVQILINALYYVFEPNNKIHLHALVAIYNATFKPELEVSESYFRNEEYIIKNKLLPIGFFDELERIRRSSIYETTEILSQVFLLNKVEGQQAYLQSFQDIVADFGQNEATDLGAYLQWWEEKGKNNSVQLSDQQNALKIISIHKSKGLAFKVVLVPYCDWPLKPSSFMDTIIWTQTEQEPFNRFKRFPIIFRKYLVNSIFYKEYYEELLYSMIDALNMLYVAFTRPREELIIMAPRSDKSVDKYNSVADILYHAISNSSMDDTLHNLNEYYVEKSSLFEMHENYMDIDGDKFLKEYKEKASFTFDQYPSGDWNTKINILHSADDFFMKSIEYIENKVNYGTLMHELFSRIKNEKDVDTIVDEFYFAGKINAEERKILVAKVQEMVTRPAVLDWFSDKWQVKTEDAILQESGKIRIPDRVLIRPGETVVIDFKFGQQYAESKEQVKEYVKLLESMNYPAVKGYVYYAEKNIVDVVS